MKNINLFLVNSTFTAAVIYFTVLSAMGNSIQDTDDSTVGGPLQNSSDYMSEENTTITLDCVRIEYDLKYFTVLENNDLFMESTNTTVHPSEYQKEDGKILMCLPFRHGTDNVLNCTEYFDYSWDEFRILPNKSALISSALIPEEKYELYNGSLLICAPESRQIVNNRTTVEKISIYVGKIGSVISIIALILYLSTFILLPSLRNLPGYNLASLSVAFLFAYFFVLIGQIPDVLGLSCIVSGVFQQYFFLAAFFCMNVLAFDIWRTLKYATEKLIVGSRYTRNRQFIWYSLYAWGFPVIITSISVTADNVEGFPSNIKPHYGQNDICWMGNNIAKAIFFAVPAFTLVIINAIFFAISAWIIYRNRMKCSEDQNRQAVKLNYILYVRLALMMGLTWLVGIIALASSSDAIWLIFDILNSLQGLFLFLLFACTRRVFKQLSGKISFMGLVSSKHTTLASSTTTVSTKI